MPDTLTDGNWTLPAVDGPPRFIPSLPFTSKAFYFEQDYVQNEMDWVATALNTASPDFPTYVLVEEGPPQSPGSGVRHWTRKYAIVPDSWSEPGGDYSYNFIGIVSFPSLPLGRTRQILEVPLRIQRDYFLIGSGGSYPTDVALVAAQTIPQQTYYLTLYPSSFVQLITAAAADVPTTPPAETYLAWVAAGTEIAVDTSVFVRWMGNIWCRETRYVKAR